MPVGKETMNTKKAMQLVCGVALIAAAACGWHYWHISDVLAVMGVIVGIIMVGDAVDF
jgi:acyl-coenzyme A synthetase/AMP-(fatty) acid ligase